MLATDTNGHLHHQAKLYLESLSYFVRRLEELAAPYLILKNKGHDVTIASVKGGKIPLDPTSMKPENLTSHAQTFLDSSEPPKDAPCA